MDQRLLAAPHGFSQRATSFIASWCQGIHRTPLSCSSSRDRISEDTGPTLHRNHPTSDLSPENKPHPDAVPPEQLREQPPSRRRTHNAHPVSHLRVCATELRGLGITTSSGQTCSSLAQMRQTLIHDLKNIFDRIRRHDQNITMLAQSLRSDAHCHVFLSHRDDGQPLVEVDGIEPTTPCLQSRCSPTELHPPGDNRMKVFWFFSSEKNRSSFL